MSANCNKRKRSNRKKKNKLQKKTETIKRMKTGEVDSEKEIITRPRIQQIESFHEQFSSYQQSHQDLNESLIMNSKSFVNDLGKVQSNDQGLIKSIEQMSNMICEKLE